MFNGDWGAQPKSSEDGGHLIGISSEEAATVENALFGFNVDKMNDDVSWGARSLSNIKPDILVYACTSGTYHEGYIQFDQEMSAEMQWVSGVPSITAVGACIEAFRFMGSQRLSIAGPYRHFHPRHGA